ncbi:MULTISPECIES: FAD-binding oxidoreductase [unclassified Bacillus (in: firmicutes)]|uniref:FAD-binding oxidoreductase n=1 Tax=unclassified Bacillus (in: firmicutes) TaxID=185979 RepID=UPI0008E90A5C|nr:MULTISPECIES: FAD-binding oxidoreductase [unclassified Bacillus (in: firmicutes)]SFA70032.1 FAD/FMN-containing dehydrogenase [Bacillus sp. UNCCL13]SFQ59506.1 FAD/FMN-containing dehydrogenase [Bacillus sp. cl95]
MNLSRVSNNMRVLHKKPWFLGIFLFVFVLWIFWNIPIEKRKYGLSQSNMTTDYTGLLPERIKGIVKAGNRTELQKIVKEANQKGFHISIAGQQHSQGGHTYYKDAVVLDMKAYNKVLAIDEQNKTIKVEAGATWEDVQEAITPYGLALKVTQSQSIFTIGGSLSVNAHGRDIRFGPMAGTVKEMTILTPTGELKKVTHNDSEDWMKYVLGGYGLFGVILDVTLELTENDIYLLHTEEIQTKDYESYFANLISKDNVAMHYARVSVAPSSFLKEMYVIDYKYTGQQDFETSLKEEHGARLGKLALDLGRQGGRWEDLFWENQKRLIHSIDGDKTTRNNAMRGNSAFMEYTKPGRVEVLQEFFIPVNQYEEYMNDLKKWLPANDQNDDFKIHNITVRYVSKENNTTLNYAKEDMFGLVILIQHGLKEEEIDHAEAIIQEWTNLTLEYGGTYYLPYYHYQTKEQFRQSYPEWEKFNKEKLKRDPNGVFQNIFYDYYF